MHKTSNNTAAAGEAAVGPQAPRNKPPRLLRIAGVQERTALSRSSIYRLMSANHFPRPVPLGEHGRGWLESEIEAWIEARIRERDLA